MFRKTFAKTVKIGNRTIGLGENIFLTAEIGAAHDGDFELLKKMVAAAAKAGFDGADIFMAEPHDFYYTAMSGGRDYFKSWERLYFTDAQWREILAYGAEHNIVVYPTPLDQTSVGRCAELDLKMVNINSDDVNNYLLLKDIAALKVPITMHDIDQTLSEVEGAVKTLIDNGAKDIILLHSTLESGDNEFAYATANLEVMNTYRQAFSDLGALVGCVEHTTSDYLIHAVAAMRPALISKHIQLNDKNPHDNRISVNLDKLEQMVHQVRMVEMALGSGVNQRVIQSDGSIPPRWRNKVLIANRFISAGKVIEEADLCARRPGDYGGLHPWTARMLVGAKARTDIDSNTKLDLNMFQDFVEPGYKFPETQNHISIVTDSAKRVIV